MELSINNRVYQLEFDYAFIKRVESGNDDLLRNKFSELVADCLAGENKALVDLIVYANLKAPKLIKKRRLTKRLGKSEEYAQTLRKEVLRAMVRSPICFARMDDMNQSSKNKLSKIVQGW